MATYILFNTNSHAEVNTAVLIEAMQMIMKSISICKLYVYLSNQSIYKIITILSPVTQTFTQQQTCPCNQPEQRRRFLLDLRVFIYLLIRFFCIHLIVYIFFPGLHFLNQLLTHDLTLVYVTFIGLNMKRRIFFFQKFQYKRYYY